jgi:hypothetical protein
MIVGAAACAPEPASPDRARSTVATCDAREIQADYFGGQLTRRPNDRRLVEYYSRILRNQGAPPLYCDRADVDEEYRLREGYALGGYSETVRVTKRGEQYRIRAATTLERDGGFSSNQRVERQITPLEWTRIIKVIEPLGLWQPPPALPTPVPRDPIMILDVSSYLVEARKGSRYRAVRMELTDLQKFERIGGVMFSIASRPTTND